MTADECKRVPGRIMPQQLAREDIAGAVILSRERWQDSIAKGYGYSDVEKKTLVSPTIHSSPWLKSQNSSPGLAVIALVEQGKLNLDRDITTILISAFGIGDKTVPDVCPNPDSVRQALRKVMVCG